MMVVTKMLVAVIVMMMMIAEAKQFDAYRMLQFDQPTNSESGYSKLGPVRSILNAPSMAYRAQLALDAYAKSTVVIDDSDFNLTLLRQLLEADVAGIVVLLAAGKHRDLKSLGDLQQLGAIDINVPLYFVKSEEFDRSYLDSDYRLIVSGASPTPMPVPPIANIDGILRGQTPAESYVSPTILVVAHYDSFGVVPGLRGATGNEPATGVVALLELSRLFSRLYANVKNQGNHNILFLLSGGSSLNFEGTRKWLDQQPMIVTESIEFVLCLDSIGEPVEDLFFDSFLESWLESLASTTRMYPFAESTSASASGEITLLQGLERIMKNYLNEVNRDLVRVDPTTTNTYYQPWRVTMSFYHVKPFTFDLLVVVGTIVYLLAIYLLFKGNEAIKEIKHFISPLIKSKSK
ncbi:hypothetical protein PPL_07230 [Heterostelium album PN500]|uniref:BOS complex subunit NCLN n=1 Tax=Heterostelium pallidum (strain ATCC 26659 / Pp 5 / PN500) TaxID=670386 RepID=D3BER5_HETP5|nr:hypothetical protein PPL_07230 [Heterostelium album PN500]EFA80396.1 hypothetical protein PPL_07230 [Heterostelium album PN500]|eukprot:XP_020432516.1 hypothetical protein PPL_07230 [Heterostelium album PN500]